eukprot:c1727_g1_i1.p1 GENE.c1727_g1_i1~~c1727_g1_i1.p1  ORF type:complete len:219 (+),score=88.44 c1727_g1_i1:43-699(+)
MREWLFSLCFLTLCLFFFSVNAVPVPVTEEQARANNAFSAPAYMGKQPMTNFHDMFPNFGMPYQPLSQLSSEDPANQMGRRQHYEWGGHYPQEWNNPLPHNSPVDVSRVSSSEDAYPGRAIAPFWWNEPPWWWKQGPWWLQRVKTRPDGRPYGVLGDGPEVYAEKKELASPMREYHQISKAKNYEPMPQPANAQNQNKKQETKESKDSKEKKVTQNGE